MSLEKYSCKLCYLQYNDKLFCRVYTCVLTEEEKQSPDFNEDDARNKAITTDRICTWCIDDDAEGVAQTVSGVYYYRDSRTQVEGILEDERSKLASILQGMQLAESGVCVECNKKLYARDNIGLCGVCGESIHVGCGPAADSDDDDTSSHRLKESCNDIPAHSRSITIALDVFTCTSCRTGCPTV